jgi:hypothetical protein
MTQRRAISTRPSRTGVHRRVRNGNCQFRRAVSHSKPGRARRFVIDALIALASLTVVVTLVVAIDSTTGDQVARAIRKGAPADGRVAVQLREDGMNLMRTAMDTAQMHAPLTTFVGVSLVLMLFMLRMK